MAKAKLRTHGGFPIDTEVLTANGWEKMYSVDGNTQVMVLSKDNKWLPKNEIRKIDIPSGGWIWEIVNENGVLAVGEGERIPTTAGMRAVGSKWPALHVYTALAGGVQVRMHSGAIAVMIAYLRYGVINAKGYGLYVRDKSQRDILRAILNRDGVTTSDGWEKWEAVISTPRIRGLSINLNDLCPTNAQDVMRAYTTFIESTSLTKAQASELQKYFVMSGVGCYMVGGPNRYSIFFAESNLAKVFTTTRRRIDKLCRLAGCDGRIAIRQGGSTLLVNIWQK